MHSPVAPQSTSAETDFFSAVSVVSISTFNFSAVGLLSVAAIMSSLGSSFSEYYIYLFLRVEFSSLRVGEGLFQSGYAIVAHDGTRRFFRIRGQR